MEIKNTALANNWNKQIYIEVLKLLIYIFAFVAFVA